MRVSGKSLSTSTSLGGGGTPQVGRRTQPQPLSVILFGKAAPRLVDKRRHPKLGKGLKKLELAKDQIAEILGAHSGAFSLELCEGENASINRDGRVAFGIEFLEKHGQNDDLLVAVLAHEIGHRPWEWPTGDLSHLKPQAINTLYKEEEAKADRFAGRALADLGLSPEAVCDFLLAAEAFEAHPPADYYPAETRVKIIKEAYRRRLRALANASQLSPRVAARARELR